MKENKKPKTIAKEINKNLSKIRMLYSKLETEVIKVFLSPKEVTRVIGYKDNLPYNKNDELKKYDMYTPKHIFATTKKNKKAEPKKPIIYKSLHLKHPKVNPYSVEDKKCPTIFFIHGGSWTSGDKSLFYTFCSIFASLGYTVFAINYRLLPAVQIDTCYRDCVEAMAYILKKHAKLIDLDKIVMCGDSAGAMLSSLITANINNGDLKFKQKFTIKGAILFYGVYNMHCLDKVDFAGLKQVYQFTKLSQQNAMDYLDLYSPINHITPSFPPTYVSVGQVDKLYSETVDFISMLFHNNVEVTPLIFDEERIDGAHAFMNVPLAKSFKQNIVAIKKFLSDIL